MNHQPIDLQAVRQKREKKKHADLALAAYDDLEHQEKRQQLESRAEVERSARERI